jgi:hypothetical protein
VSQEIPDETAGPYPGDGSNGPNVLTESGVVRSDITTSFRDFTGTAQAVPMTLELIVRDLANGGTPFAGVAVYVWHCDREARYSLYSDGATDQNYLPGSAVRGHVIAPDRGVTCRNAGSAGEGACAYASSGCRRGCLRRAGWVQRGDAGWWGDLAGPKNAGLDVGEWGGLDDGAGAAGQGDGVQPAELEFDASPGQAGAAFGDADEQQRPPAQQHVRADPRFDAVEHRP